MLALGWRRERHRPCACRCWWHGWHAASCRRRLWGWQRSSPCLDPTRDQLLCPRGATLAAGGGGSGGPLIGAISWATAVVVHEAQLCKSGTGCCALRGAVFLKQPPCRRKPTTVHAPGHVECTRHHARGYGCPGSGQHRPRCWRPTTQGHARLRRVTVTHRFGAVRPIYGWHSTPHQGGVRRGASAGLHRLAGRQTPDDASVVA